MHDATPQGVSWLATSRGDYDQRQAVKGHKRGATDQGGLFYVATPTAERAAPARVELPGQGALDLFGTGDGEATS
jgi:hypothetical protein